MVNWVDRPIKFESTRHRLLRASGARELTVNFRRTLKLFLPRGERGAAMIEYGLLVVLIAIVALVAVELAGGEVSQTYSEIASGLVNT